MEQRRFKAAGLAIFMVAAGALIARIAVYFAYSALSKNGEVSDLILEVIFTLPVQILVCFVVPLVIYRFYGKRSIGEVFLDSYYGKADYRLVLLGGAVGVGAIFVSSVVGRLWLAILMGFGYTYSPSESYYPQVFSVGYFLLAMFFTAVLPALCEEFAMRGTFLRSMRGSLRTERAVLVVMALSFGLFHQNIVQLVYTAIFGAMMAFLVLRSGSIYPAIAAHFVNNAIVVLLGYADNYGWFLDPTYYLTENFGLVGLAMTLAVGVGICFLAIWSFVLLTNKKAAFKPPSLIYKPSFRQMGFYVGAVVMSVLSTIFTFMFGF